MIGNSLINGLSRYTNTWKRYLNPLDAINCGDRVQNILWRCVNLPKSPSIRNAIILCGTNNIQFDTTEDIADGILEIALTLRSKYHLINVICGLIPRDDIWSINRIYINEINNGLLYKCKQNGFTFIDQKDWTLQDGSLKPNFFYVDKLHLVEDGNAKLAESIVNAINTNDNNYTHATTSSILLSNTKEFHFNQEDFPPLPCNLFVRNAVCNPVKPVVKWCSNTLVTSKSVNCHNVRLNKPVGSCNVRTIKPVCSRNVRPSKPANTSNVNYCKPVCTSNVDHSKPVCTSNVNYSKPVCTSNVNHSKPVCTSDVVRSKPACTRNVCKSKQAVQNVNFNKVVFPVDVGKPHCENNSMILPAECCIYYLKFLLLLFLLPIFLVSMMSSTFHVSI